MESENKANTIELGQDTLKDLNTTRKWTMFFAILGFIVIGIMVIGGLFAGIFLSLFQGGGTGPGFPEWLVFIIVLAFGAVYFFPVLYLFRFSRHMANAVKTADKLEIHKAFRNLKFYYVFTGVLVIIILVAYVIAIIVAGASVALLKSF